MTEVRGATLPAPSARPAESRKAGSEPPTSASRWIPGLDGLRAIAVIAVVVFHLNPDYLPAGFLGVDLFFVISGYLITRLLLGERSRAGKIRLGRFYLRRARRLLPALFALLAAVGVFGAVFWPDQRPTLAGGVVSSLGYGTNWWMIADQQSYFVAMGRPPMLQHLWSLAIEEQFYLVWAPAVVALTALPFLRRIRRGRLRPELAVAGTAAVLALCSTAAMAIIAVRTNVPYQTDSSRVYFGTDTHAMGLLIGAAAGALAMTPWRELRRRIPRWVLPAWRASWTPGPLLPVWLTQAAERGSGLRWASDVAAVAGLAAMTAVFVTVDEFVPGLYRGGFAVFALVAAVTVCAIARHGGRVGRLLDIAPLAWIGRRSYGIYLWHWPVLVVTRPDFDLAGPAWLIDVARAGLVVVLAALSYRFLEVPIRRDGFGAWARATGRVIASARRRLAGPRPDRRVPAWRRRLAPGAAASAILAVVCASVLVTAGFGTPHAHNAAAEPVPATPLTASSAAPSSAPILTFPSESEGGATSAPAQSSAPSPLPPPAGIPSSGPAASSSAAAGASAAGASAAGASTAGASTASDAGSPVAATSRGAPDATASTSARSAAATSAPVSSAAATRPVPSSPPAPKPVVAPPATSTPATPKAPVAAVSAFGDSVLLGAAPAVDAVVGSLSVDAVVGRQAWDTLAAIVAAHQAKSLAPVVLIHTGNNGVISPKQLAATLDLLRDRARVVVVNDHVDRAWQGPNNKTIAAATAHRSNVVVVDWNAAAKKNPAWFGPDGIHVNRTGAKAYAALVATALG